VVTGSAKHAGDDSALFGHAHAARDALRLDRVFLSFCHVCFRRFTGAEQCT
jgi:hypothetical protein